MGGGQGGKSEEGVWREGPREGEGKDEGRVCCILRCMYVHVA